MVSHGAKKYLLEASILISFTDFKRLKNSPINIKVRRRWGAETREFCCVYKEKCDSKILDSPLFPHCTGKQRFLLHCVLLKRILNYVTFQWKLSKSSLHNVFPWKNRTKMYFISGYLQCLLLRSSNTFWHPFFSLLSLEWEYSWPWPSMPHDCAQSSLPQLWHWASSFTSP